jgi:hypothetical protein
VNVSLVGSICQCSFPCKGGIRLVAPDYKLVGRLGSQSEHLQALVEAVAAALERNPNFLRILVVMATQPVNADGGEVHRVVDRVREMALNRLRNQMEIVFGVDRHGETADHLARFALAAFDGAFVAQQSNPKLRLGDLLRHLPAALIAVRRDLT